MRDKLAEAIQAILPADLASDVRDNLDAVLRSNFEKMNLITREQFEIQQKILDRTRERVVTLERQLKILEDSLNKNASDADTNETING